MLFLGSRQQASLFALKNQRARARTSIYPEISVSFVCSGDAHYHLPLLLSDNSYTTYRGS
jgi:5-hydroxyisourate hydrolase-like protein (transthyretin family)